jgi:hypothetical protein
MDGIIQEDEPSVHEEKYEKLQDSCIEAKLLKDEADDDESNKIRKAEMDLLSALQRVSFVLWVHIHTAACIICKAK